MNEEQRSVSNVDGNGDGKAHQRSQDFPGKERPEPRRDAPDEPIENTDPNAAENQGEPGQESATEYTKAGTA